VEEGRSVVGRKKATFEKKIKNGRIEGSENGKGRNKKRKDGKTVQ